jgi:Tat protein translocase TatB subunit
MFGLGGGELFLVLLLAILLIGPRDLPRVATQIGRFYRKLRSAAEDLKDTVERETEWKDPPRTLEKK